LGFEGAGKDLFRVIDKIDKLGVDGVINELSTLHEFQGIGKPLNETDKEILKEFLSIKSGDPLEVLGSVRKILGGKTPNGDLGITAMDEIVQNLNFLGIPKEFWSIDLSIARGLDYYTGPVFETYITDVPTLGSVFSGGRFDGLTNRFVPGSNIAGVGASVGVDRIIIALESKGLVTKKTATADVLVTVFNGELSGYAMALGEKLRDSGIRTEVYVGEPVSFKAQIVYAIKRGIRFVIIAGPDEVSRNVIGVKDTSDKSQITLTIEEAIASIRSRLL
jgi:histidyl-tRNA synthetase